MRTSFTHLRSLKVGGLTALAAFNLRGSAFTLRLESAETTETRRSGDLVDAKSPQEELTVRDSRERHAPRETDSYRPRQTEGDRDRHEGP